MLLGLKRRDSIEKLIAQDTKAPDIHTSIMLYALHCFTTSKVLVRYSCSCVFAEECYKWFFVKFLFNTAI